MAHSLAYCAQDLIRSKVLRSGSGQAIRSGGGGGGGGGGGVVQHHLQRVESLLEEQCNISDLEQNDYLKTATGNASMELWKSMASSNSLVTPRSS